MNELVNDHYEELYHHGVKGMKWGVRKKKKTSIKDKKRIRLLSTKRKIAANICTDLLGGALGNMAFRQLAGSAVLAKYDIPQFVAGFLGSTLGSLAVDKLFFDDVKWYEIEK